MFLTDVVQTARNSCQTATTLHYIQLRCFSSLFRLETARRRRNFTDFRRFRWLSRWQTTWRISRSKSRSEDVRASIYYICVNQVYFFRYVIESKSVCNCCMIIEVPSRTWYSTVSKVFIDSNVDILQSLSNSWCKKNECWLKEPIRQFPNYSTNPNRPCAFIIRNFNKLSQIFFIIQTSHSFYLVQ